MLLFAAVLPASPQSADVIVYGETLDGGWADWSWCSHDLASTSPVHQGTHAVRVTFAAWTGLYFHAVSPVTSTAVTSIDFWVHGGETGGQRLRLVVNGDYDNGYPIGPVSSQWTHVSVPMSSFGNPGTIAELVWQDTTGGPQAAVYLDDVVLVAGAAPPPPPPGVGPALTVDVASDRAPISPLIYGMNFADEALAAELDLPVNRWGGNATTRYNWQTDVSNRASDWFFENIANDSVVASLPDGSAADLFVQANRVRDTETLLTVPLIGWTPKSRAPTCGFSVAKYGAQQATDGWRPDCGNGVRPDGTTLAGNDPADTSVVIGPSFVGDWISHLRVRFGPGAVRYFNLDNEPELWNSTHRDVHPQALSYDELLQRSVAYARAVKDAEPQALTLGPVAWGWTAYFYSAADAGAGGNWWDTRADRRAHDDLPLVEWYLREMRAQGERDGRRLLDFLDLHYYPQAAGVSLQGEGGSSTQALRLRSTRSLWDPAYADESWINGTEGGPAVRLIPRMRAWVDTYYPGTRLALTEYNWGALDHINGALAQADVLGIFGREQLDLATLWDPPAPAQPGAFAFRMFRNYDGAGHQFGETRIRAVSADQATLAVYAAQRGSDNAVTILVINKSSSMQATTLAVAGTTTAGPARVFRYSEADLAHIQHLGDQPWSTTVTLSFPARSITLFEVPVRGDLGGESAVIRGTVRDGVSAMPGASVTLSNGCTGSASTGSDGSFHVTVPVGATCRVTPSAAGRSFVPASRDVVVNADVAGIDFVANAAGSAAIVGVVRDLNGTGIGGVTITATQTGHATVTTTTADDGSYSVAGLVAGAAASVTPARPAFAFAPAAQTLPAVQATVTATPFIAQSGAFMRYLAEGATSASFDTTFALLNATSGPTDAVLSFQRPDGSRVQRTVSVGAGARATVRATDQPELASAEFATVIASAQPLVVDRTMTWGASAFGAHAETSLPAPAPTWYLAEGHTGNFALFYLLQNPNDVEAVARVRFLRPSAAPLEKTYALPPASRTNIWVNVEEFGVAGRALADTDVSAVIEVTNGRPIIVERAMYVDLPGQPFGAGHESAGVTTPSTQWFLAEGATGPYFDLFVLIANPGPSTAQVEATFLLPGGSTMAKVYTVPGNSRYTIWVDREDARLADTAVSTRIRVTNDVPVIVERAMWWPDGQWYEAHNSPGSTTTGTMWALADGEVGGALDTETFILLANTSSTAATIDVRILFEDGMSNSRTFTVGGQSRFNVDVRSEFPSAIGRRFGAVVESVGTVPAQIVVERAMYWDADGQWWAAGTNALATRLR